MFSRCVVVKTCAKYEEIKKRDLFLFFFFLSLSRRSLGDFYYPKQKLFFGWSKVKKKKKREEEKHTKTFSSLFTHETHLQSCLLLLNKSRPSPASRPPRSKCVRLVRVFALPLWRLKTRSLSLSLSLLCPRRNAAQK